MLLGHMVTRNEIARYLPEVLIWHRFLDGLHVYDDQSTDETPVLCEDSGALVSVRPEGVPSFAEHEGAFRQAAWDDFVAQFRPSPDDWVVALDADEFFCVNRATGFKDSVSNARSLGVISLTVQVYECFGWEDGVPMIRTDGYWSEVFAKRIFAFQEGGRFRQDNLGCGSAPRYVDEGPTTLARDVAILHFGYARKEDRLPKYNRYLNDPGNNHNKGHAMSIMENPTVEPWTGEIPVRG